VATVNAIAEQGGPDTLPQVTRSVTTIVQEDAQSVRPEDLVPSDLVYPNRVGDSSRCTWSRLMDPA
jgi:hypothetical protein